MNVRQKIQVLVKTDAGIGSTAGRKVKTSSLVGVYELRGGDEDFGMGPFRTEIFVLLSGRTDDGMVGTPELIGELAAFTGEIVVRGGTPQVGNIGPFPGTLRLVGGMMTNTPLADFRGKAIIDLAARLAEAFNVDGRFGIGSRVARWANSAPPAKACFSQRA